MGVDGALAGGPDEDGEAAVLGGDEGDGVPLVLDELGSREVARPADVAGVDGFGDAAFDGLPHRDPVDLGAAVAAPQRASSPPASACSARPSSTIRPSRLDARPLPEDQLADAALTNESS